MVAVSVIVVNYNAGAHLSRCLRALAAQSFADFEAIVIDNASSDGSFEAARAAIDDPRFAFAANPANLGFAAANNRAAARARGAWLALLNPDAFASPDWLARLVAAAKSRPDIAIFGSTQLMDADPTRLDGAGDRCLAGFLPWRSGYGAPAASVLPRAPYPTATVCAAAMFVRGDVFRRLGGFEESYFAYCEDVDFGLRAIAAGESALQAPDAIVRHVGGASAGRYSAFVTRHGARNALRTFARNLPRGAALVLLPAALAVWMAFALRALGRGTAGAALAGIGEALACLPRDLARPRGNTGAVMRALDWKPIAALRRAGPRR